VPPRISLAGLALMGVLATASPSTAHHADTIYDKERLVTLVGVVAQFEFKNPHNLIYLDVQDRGILRRWAIYGAAPVALARVGWNQETIRVGEQLTITGFRRKDGRRGLLHLKIARANGEPVPMGEAEEEYLEKFERLPGDKR